METAIATIYALARRPDAVCGQLIRDISQETFSSETSVIRETTPTWYLVKLLILLGHVATQQLVRLESIERHYKASKDLHASRAAAAGVDTMAGIGASADDEFSDLILHVKERELLYGESSILAVFGSVVRNICLNNHIFSVLFTSFSASYGRAQIAAANLYGLEPCLTHAE